MGHRIPQQACRLCIQTFMMLLSNLCETIEICIKKVNLSYAFWIRFYLKEVVKKVFDSNKIVIKGNVKTSKESFSD